MGYLPFLLLLCLASGTLCHPEEDVKSREERKADKVRLGTRKLVEQLATMINRLQDELTTYKNQVVSYGKQMTSMGSELKAIWQKVDGASKSVAFTARISVSRDNNGAGMALGHHQTLVFDNVVNNIGSAYSPTTGIFTANVNGTYAFFLRQMSANTESLLILAIVKNGTVLDLVFARGSDGINNQGSGHVTTHLAAGDHVWVRQGVGNRVRGGWLTVFTGFLLHAD